jgi:hypothetical protein
MAIAVPMLVDPMENLVSDLPFVNALTGSSFREHILQSFSVSHHKQDCEQVMLLHLYSQTGPVLLEMVVNVVVVDSKPYAVLTGREVDSGLATLIAGGDTSKSGSSSSVSWASDQCFVSGAIANHAKDLALARGMVSDEDSEERNQSAKLQSVWRKRRRQNKSIMMSERNTAAAPRTSRAAAAPGTMHGEDQTADLCSTSSDSTAPAWHGRCDATENGTHSSGSRS